MPDRLKGTQTWRCPIPTIPGDVIWSAPLYNIITRKHFRCCWPFVRWIIWAPVESPQEGSVAWRPDVFIDIGLNKWSTVLVPVFWHASVLMWRYCNTQPCKIIIMWVLLCLAEGNWHKHGFLQSLPMLNDVIGLTPLYIMWSYGNMWCPMFLPLWGESSGHQWTPLKKDQ